MINSNFYNEIEKRAIGIGTALMGVLSAHGVKDKANNLKKTTTMPPPNRAGQANLNTPYTHQFKGSNRTDSSGSRYPISSLYQ